MTSHVIYLWICHARQLSRILHPATVFGLDTRREWVHATEVNSKPRSVSSFFQNLTMMCYYFLQARPGWRSGASRPPRWVSQSQPRPQLTPRRRPRRLSGPCIPPPLPPAASTSRRSARQPSRRAPPPAAWTLTPPRKRGRPSRRTPHVSPLLPEGLGFLGFRDSSGGSH